MRGASRGIVGLAALALAFLTGTALAAERTELRFGSGAMDIPAEMARRIVPLTRFLSESLERPVVPQLSRTIEHTIDQLEQGDVDIAILTPAAYVQAKERGARILVQPTSQGRKTFHLMVMTRDSGSIRSLNDLVGKRFAFGDPAALLQYVAMREARLPVQKLGEIQYLRYHDVVARAVAQGDVDAGVMRESTALGWRDKGLRAIYTSPKLPSYAIAASAKLDSQTLHRVREAFLRLDARNPVHRAVIRALDPLYDGFVPGNDRDYNIVRASMARYSADAVRERAHASASAARQH